MDPITLSIDAAALERLRIDEGSLCIKARARSEQRVPLARLQRIDVMGYPAASMECLLDLAARSVPVTFFRATGSVRAQLFHPQPRVTALSHWTSELFTVHGDAVCYRRWKEHHLRAVYAAAGVHGGSLEQMDREHGRLCVAALTRSGLAEVYAEGVGRQEGMVGARAGEHLLRWGVTPGGPAHARLSRDLCALAKRWLLGKTIHWLQQLGANATSPDFQHYMTALSSRALDEWLHLLLSRLTELAASGALHREPRGDDP